MKTKLSDRQIYERSLTENDVLGQIRQLLELNGARVFRVIERIPWGKTKSEGGIPDLFGWFTLPKYAYVMSTGLLRPTHFFIEVKRKGGKFRPAQARWLEQAQADGVIAFKADSVEEMVAEFKRFGIEIKGLQ